VGSHTRSSTMQPDDCYLDWMNIGIRKEAETDSACVYLFICTRYRRRTDHKRIESLGEVIGKFATWTIGCWSTAGWSTTRQA